MKTLRSPWNQTWSPRRGRYPRSTGGCRLEAPSRSWTTETLSHPCLRGPRGGARSRFHRPKFDRYVGREVRAVYLAQLEAVSEWVSIAGAKLGCRDRDDDKLLETALMGEADCLVTGDRDLLEMSPFNDIPILTPAGFLDFRVGG